MTEKSISICVEGQGSEFIYHRLNKNEAYDLMDSFHSNENKLWAFDLGILYQRSIFSGAYSPDPFCMEVSNLDSGEIIDLSDVRFVCDLSVGDLIGYPVPEPSVLDYVYIAKPSGRISGVIEIPLGYGDEFHPENLTIHYVEYSFENVLHVHGRLISKVEYNGSQVYNIQFEDNGSDVYVSLHGYDFSNGSMNGVVQVFSEKFDGNDVSGKLDAKELARVFEG